MGDEGILIVGSNIVFEERNVSFEGCKHILDINMTYTYIEQIKVCVAL